MISYIVISYIVALILCLLFAETLDIDAVGIGFIFLSAPLSLPLILFLVTVLLILHFVGVLVSGGRCD